MSFLESWMTSNTEVKHGELRTPEMGNLVLTGPEFGNIVPGVFTPVLAKHIEQPVKARLDACVGRRLIGCCQPFDNRLSL
jgi:hypothetical protein